MEEKKMKNSTSTAMAASSLSSSQVSGQEYDVQNQGHIACGRDRGKHTPSLPDDIIFNILLRLPANVLYEVMRYVCKGWYHTVNGAAFIRAHHQVSSTGILCQGSNNKNAALYLEANATIFKLTQLRFPFPAKVVGSCHGLLLLCDGMNSEILHVMNLVTKVNVSLPPLVQLSRFSGQYSTLTCTSSGLHKVVHLCDDLNPKVQVMVFVCTVGVDRAWRVIDVEGVHMTRLSIVHFVNPPQFVAQYVAQFVYWFHIFDRVGFALDVDAETTHNFSGPESGDGDIEPTSISIEKSLGVVNYQREKRIWVVWKLTDLRSGTWTKVLIIDVASVLHKLPMLNPPRRFTMSAVTLKNGELWMRIFTGENFLVCYNLKQGNVLSYEADMEDGHPAYYAHMNTLVSPKNCEIIDESSAVVEEVSR